MRSSIQLRRLDHTPRSLVLILGLTLALAACERRVAVESVVSPPASTVTAPTGGAAPLVAVSAPGGAAVDRYDVSKMDFKSPPAVLSSVRHTGPFATGAALNMEASIKPLDPAPVKEIRLDTTHKIIEIAPGVKFSAWTFGDTVPGPAVRARVGDRIKFTMTNRSDEPIPGVRVTAAPMMHSMDFHSAMMIVEPRDGYPTKVDREYAVIQSEFYTKPDPQKRKVDGQPLYVLDGDRVRSKAPTYTVFNGRYNGMVDKPLQAKPGERVRLFVMNVGPSNTSSFHVVGTIFDRVWIDGNPDNQVRGMQTVLLGSSGGAIVEFMIPEAGSYVMVDHHFANASQGAIGIIAAGGMPEGGDPEHHNIPATSAPTDPNAQKGKLAFESKCLACHSIGGGDKLGPDLFGTTKRHDESWLTRWLKSPEQMLQSDPHAKAMLDKWKIPMPNQGLSDDEIKQYLAYFKWADQNLQPKQTGQPQPSASGTALPPSQTRSTTPMPAPAVSKP